VIEWLGGHLPCSQGKPKPTLQDKLVLCVCWPLWSLRQSLKMRLCVGVLGEKVFFSMVILKVDI